MGKKKLYTGIILGAVIGGLSTLYNKDVRDYTKEKLTSAKSKTSYYIKNPSNAIYNVRTTVDQLNRNIADGASNTINALEQIEDTLDKVIKKDDKKQELID